MKKIIIPLLLFFIFSTHNLIAQENVIPFQFTFIDPVGTNGVLHYKKTNALSFALLGSISKSNAGFDFASLFSINRDTNYGLQLAGLTNFSGTNNKSAQIAGITNVNLHSDRSFQLAGIANFSKITNGGTQIAGISNIATNGTTDLQCSPVINLADSVGVQLGLLNLAGTTKGAQVGLINFSKSAEGAHIGMFNFIAMGGKYEFEISTSEALHTAATFKFGTQQLYTILSAGIHYTSPKPDYAVGIGWGTQLTYQKGWSNEFEALGYLLTEGGRFLPNSTMSTLGQLRFLTGKSINKNMKLFFGPTLNMTISDYKNPATGIIGSGINPYSFWENTGSRFQLRGWIGVTGGVRF